jgi:ABC-type antimicrobial peptide transport system permease subunit
MFEQGEDLNLDEPTPPPAGRSNRTFIIVAGILGGIVFISIVCMAVYALFYLPQQKTRQSAQQATIEVQNQLISQAMTQTMIAVGARASQEAATQKAPEKTATTVILSSSTPVLAIATETQVVDPAALTATFVANNTQVALSSLTPTRTPTSSMPTSGFADEIGLPGLVVMAIALVAVILLARRLRTVTTH